MVQSTMNNSGDEEVVQTMMNDSGDEHDGHLCLSHLSIDGNNVSGDTVYRFAKNRALAKMDNSHAHTTSTWMEGVCPCSTWDMQYRNKMILTCWLSVAFLFLGWSVNLTGPSFPDLRLITGADLESASWIFTSGSFGYLIGSFIGGVAFDKFNQQIVMCISLTGLAVFNVAVPFCPHLWMMCTVMAICGCFEGSIETGGNAMAVAVWGSEGKAPLLAMYFAESTGGIIAPFTLQPFLAKETKLCHSAPYNSYASLTFNHSEPNMLINTSISLQSDNTSKFINGDTLNASIYGNNATSACELVYGNTRMHYAYGIITTLMLIAAVPFFVLYLTSRKRAREDDVDEDNSDSPTRLTKLPKKLKIVILILLSSVMFIQISVEDNFTSFLMTFCVSHLNWTKSYGAMANSLTWASITFGRFVGIFVVKFVRICTVINVCLCVLILSFAGCLVANFANYTVLIWVFIPVIGLALSLLTPSLFMWTEETILPVTGRISSLFLVSGSVGAMGSPLLFGYAMEDNSPVWFLYLLLGLSILDLLWYFFAEITECMFIRPLFEAKQNEEKPLNINSTVD